MKERDKLGKTLHHIYLFLYLQFASYWATIAAGMLVNYYYAIPDNLQPDFTSIFLQLFAAPSLFAHVAFAVLSTSMSIPVIVLAMRVKLMQVVLLHAEHYCTDGGFRLRHAVHVLRKFFHR